MILYKEHIYSNIIQIPNNIAEYFLPNNYFSFKNCRYIHVI